MFEVIKCKKKAIKFVCVFLLKIANQINLGNLSYVENRQKNLTEVGKGCFRNTKRLVCYSQKRGKLQGII